jgi:hypothetical protein
MILRVDGINLIEIDIGEHNDEDQYVELNSGFIKVDDLPYSASGYYKYDEDNNIIVDNDKELDTLKLERMDEILVKFDELMFYGTFDCSLGFRADNRRGEGKDDKDNVQSLIDLGNEPVYFRDADNQFHALSIEELSTLKQEMIQDGLGKYQWKWNKENEVMSAATIADLQAIEI